MYCVRHLTLVLLNDIITCQGSTGAMGEAGRVGNPGIDVSEILILATISCPTTMYCNNNNNKTVATTTRTTITTTVFNIISVKIITNSCCSKSWQEAVWMNSKLN